MKVGVSLSAFVKETARQTVNAGNLDHLTSWPHTNKESRKPLKFCSQERSRLADQQSKLGFKTFVGVTSRVASYKNAQHYFARGADRCQCCVRSEFE